MPVAVVAVALHQTALVALVAAEQAALLALLARRTLVVAVVERQALAHQALAALV